MSVVEVYGVSHSPWVQAVLLGLHDRKMAHNFRTVPPLDIFLKQGVLMPMASVDGRPWIPESADILQAIGYDPVSPEDQAAIGQAWRGVLHRPDNIWHFFNEFSKAGDRSPSMFTRLRNNFLRSFATLYFCCIIKFAVLMKLMPDPENFGDQFLYWEDRFSRMKGPFIGGESPSAADLLLFGIVQCHASIPVPPLQALLQDERLNSVRSWIGRMHKRFSDYPYLFTGPLFDPRKPGPAPSLLPDRVAFWTGSVFMVALFPLTVPMIIFFRSRL